MNDVEKHENRDYINMIDGSDGSVVLHSQCTVSCRDDNASGNFHERQL